MLMIRAFLFVSALALTAACGDDEPIPTAPTPPRPTVTENFAGTLTVNGAATHSFSSGSGTITVRLTSLSPDSAATIGVSLGTWNTTSLSCQIVIANDNATQAAVVVGNAGTTGSFCARVYDVGRLGAPTDYSLDIAHF